MNKPVIGEIVHHALLGSGAVHTLEKFNRNPSTICVQFQNEIKILPVFSLGPKNTVDPHVEILSDYLANICEIDCEIEPLDDLAAGLNAINDYLLSLSTFAPVKETKIEYITMLCNIFNKAGVYKISKEIKPLLVNNWLTSALDFLEIFED